MTTIKFTLEGINQTFNYIEKEKEYIDIDDILIILQKRDIQKNDVEYIKYLNTEYDAWELINDSDILQLNKEKGLELSIETKSNVQNEKYILKKNELMEKMYIIDKKIDEIVYDDNEKNNKAKEESSTLNIPYIKSSSSLSISENPESETTIDNYLINSETDIIDIIVLTGNPLVDKYDGDIKELKTMNDFNLITYSIHKVILDCNKQIIAKFLPLTLKNFKDAILLSPKIIHLICKSTYLSNCSKNEMKDNNNNKNESEIFSPYLLFENDKCEMERINGESFKNLIKLLIETKGGKGLLRDISLFISTPLAQDIFEMIKQCPFKNIIVQHTVYSNVAFIAEINEQFYTNIIELDKTIEESFNIAKSLNISKIESNQSCCCFHSHLNKCKLKSNLSNELYNEDEKPNQEDYYPMPHIDHLRYKCNCKQADFCKHNKINSCNNYNYSFKSKLLNSKKVNICCCEDKNIVHKINNIFFLKLSDEKEGYGLFSNYQSNNFGSIDKAEFVPSYYKMDLIVGRNKIIYNIFELLDDNNVEIINIYGSKHVESINMIDSFIDIIIEFLKERIPYMISDSNMNSNNDSCDILVEKQSSNIIGTLNKYNSSDNQIKIDMKKIDSAPLIIGTNIKIPTFEKIDIREDFQENTISIINNKANDNNKKFYFINAFDINKNNLEEKLKRIEFSKKKIIIFTEYKLENINEKEIKHIELKNLTKIDCAIKFQRQKILNSKDDNDKYIKKKIEENNIKEENFNDDTIYKDNQKFNFFNEILFLFNCSESGHFIMEIEKLFNENKEEVQQLLDNKYVPKNIIEKIEKIEKCSTKNKYYYQYIRKNRVFKAYYKARKNIIPDEVKQRVFQRLFKFYAMVFRLIIKKAKDNTYNLQKKNILLTLKKKYKPIDSLTTFSAIQELGIWESDKKISEDDNLDIYDIIGYFNHLLRNFLNILKSENIILCYKNKETWEKVSKDIEDISITLPTCLKMFSIEQDIDLTSLFKEELKRLDKYSLSSLARLELFEYMYEFNKNKQNQNYEINYEKLNEIEKKFCECGCKQGKLETLLAKCIVKNWKLKEYREFDNEELKKELSDFEKDESALMENKKRFIILFKNKIKYLYYKFKIKKIKCGELSESNKDLSELEEMLKAFKDEKKVFYVIKVLFLFCEWYLKKYNFGKRDGKKECQKEKNKFMEYLNFAYYISTTCTSNYIRYTETVIENKYKLKNKKLSKEMDNKIKALCNKYHFYFIDHMRKYYL